MFSFLERTQKFSSQSVAREDIHAAYKVFLESGNGEEFLNRSAKCCKRLKLSAIQINNLNHACEISWNLGIKTERYPSPDDYGRFNWLHEQAHIKAARKQRIRSVTMVGVFPDNLIWYAEVNLFDFKFWTGRRPDKIAETFGRILLGPKTEGAFDYEIENQFGEKFLQLAAQLRS